MTFCRGSSSKARTPSIANCLASSNCSSFKLDRSMISAYKSKASDKLPASKAAPIVIWELLSELARWSPRPSRASQSSLLLLSPAPLKIQSVITFPPPQQPSGSRDAPDGSIKPNATDPTASIGSPRRTIPFFKICLSIFSVIVGPLKNPKEGGRILPIRRCVINY